MIARVIVATAAGAVGLAVLSGCTLEEPKHGGPWAAAFEREYAQSSDPFVRAALEDGVVSDDERRVVEERYDSCMRAMGVVADCVSESGQFPVGALYELVKRNPQNLDENRIMAACLVRHGAVAGGYSSEDFASDDRAQDYPFLDEHIGAVALGECEADPLGLLD